MSNNPLNLGLANPLSGMKSGIQKLGDVTKIGEGFQKLVSRMGFVRNGRARRTAEVPKGGV
jgi:hypothetical protein